MKIVLKHKLCGKIKGRAVADGRKQRTGPNKSDVTSPTAATDSVLVTAAIDAKKGRDVSVINTAGALLMADIDKEVTVILENEMVDAMLEIDRNIYEKYVIYGENGKKHM